LTVTALDLKPASAKAFARFLYARIPGAARFRFALKDLAAQYVSKPEFGGVVRLVPSQGQIIDVGANRGQSIAAFRRLSPGCDVIAFEPEPRSAARLCAHFRDTAGVTIHNCALARAAGGFSVFIPRYGMWDCDGMAATSREEATLWLRDRGRMFRFDERRLSVEEYQVEWRTLDSFALSPVLMKLHAQGAELDILEGAADTLHRSRPALMCAFPVPAVVDFLQALDYRTHSYDAGGFTPGLAGGGATFTWFLTRAHLSRL
jgi:FkbM family methyltransferase